MPISAIDHFGIPTSDSERFLAFYKRLGFRILGEQEWRAGKSNIFSIQVGENNRINVHPAGWRPRLRGDTATPGCGDVCFVWEGTVAEVFDLLRQAGVEPLQGPVPRQGGRGAGTVPSQSVYFRDPDGNLIEYMVYERAAVAR